MDDAHGGVALFINENLNYIKRDDLSIFIPHVMETIFVEIQYKRSKPIIVGVIYRPNTLPRADLDLFISNLLEIQSKISNENKTSYLMGDYHTIIRRISVVGAWTLNFDFRENRLHDSVKTRPICYPQTSGVQYPLSLYGCIQLLQLNDFWVVLVSPLSIGYSPTAADGSALCCTIGGSLGRS